MRISRVWRLLGSWVYVFLEFGSPWETGYAYFSSLEAIVKLDTLISRVWRLPGRLDVRISRVWSLPGGWMCVFLERGGPNFDFY